MHKHWLELHVGDSPMPAYLVEPDETPRGGVIVVQEIFGVNGAMQTLTELVAGAGYLAIAPNFYHRIEKDFHADYDEAGFTKGFAAAGATEYPQIEADLSAAAHALHERLGADARIATWGFCWGGTVAYYSATLPFVDAAISFYGGQIANSPFPTRPAAIAMTGEIQAPLLLAFGGQDEYISEADVETIERTLSDHAKTFELNVYPDEHHAFFREGPEKNEATRSAWASVRTFLETYVAKGSA